MDETRMDSRRVHPEPAGPSSDPTSRNALLSRSVRENPAEAGWGGSTWKPAPAWGVSMLLVFAITAGVVWNERGQFRSPQNRRY